MCWILYWVLGIEKRLKPRPGPSGALVVGGERGEAKHGYGAWQAGWWNVSWRRGGSKEGGWALAVGTGHCREVAVTACVLRAGAAAHTHFTAEGTGAWQSAEPLS